MEVSVEDAIRTGQVELTDESGIFIYNGKKIKMLKEGIMVDPETGKLYRPPTQDEVNAAIVEGKLKLWEPKPMPKWLKIRSQVSEEGDEKWRNKSRQIDLVLDLRSRLEKAFGTKSKDKKMEANSAYSTNT